MLSELPAWIVDERASILEEVAAWRHLSAAERWRLAVLCSRDAIWAIRANSDPQRILDQVDPVPSSTAKALERMRRLTGWGRAGQ